MRGHWKTALGFVLSAVCLYVALRHTDWSAVGRALRDANPLLWLASAAAATAIFPLRARRWRTILDPLERVPFPPLWRSTAIGMSLNNLLPARIGELARAYALSRQVPSVPFAAAFASLAVDRVFDAVTILLLMFAAMLSPAFPAGAAINGRPVAHLLGSWGTLAILLLLGALYLVAVFPARIVDLFERFARGVAPGVEARGRDALVAFAAGLGVLRSPSRFAAVLGWTMLHWLCNAFAFWLGFRALGITAPFSAALFLQGLIAIGVAVPQAPGFVGVFEGLALVGLGLYRVDQTQAVSWAIGFHVLSFIPITVTGAVYFTRLDLRLADVRGGEAPDAALPAAP